MIWYLQGLGHGTVLALSAFAILHDAAGLALLAFAVSAALIGASLMDQIVDMPARRRPQ